MSTEAQAAIAKEIEKLQGEVAKKEAEAAKLKALSELYPDLKKHVNRWGTVRYYSRSVNTKVERFELRHNCGCCADSPVEVWPYIETPHGNVYSDPPRFQCGERDPWSYRDRPYGGWQEEFRKAEIPDVIIGALEIHFGDADDAPEDPELPDYEAP